MIKPNFKRLLRATITTERYRRLTDVELSIVIIREQLNADGFTVRLAMIYQNKIDNWNIAIERARGRRLIND